MFNVEQFIYTTASIENKKGYQIVAKSEGITDEVIHDLESYVYPIGIEPSKFSDSRSFVLLKKDLVAYSRIKNIGIGHDGRENTLYNHTFVFSKADFKKHGCDSRIFDKFFLEDKSARGILPTLSISSSQSFSSILDIEDIVLGKILKAIFTKKKVALLIDSIELPQKIISLLPKTMRMIPFSTFVIEPKKQLKYDFILNPELKKSKIEKEFEVISMKDTLTTKNKTYFEQSVMYYVQLTKIQKYDELKEIHKLFEKIPGSDYKNKLILLSNYLQFQSSNDEKERERYAEIALEALKQFDQDTFSYYFGKIKGSMRKYRYIEEKLSPEVSPAMSFIDALFFLPTKMMMDVYKVFSEQQTKKDTD